MKKLLLLLFLMLVSLGSYGELVYYSYDSRDDAYYLDHSTFIENDGYVYYWYLKNYSVTRSGDKSAEVYVQGDCGIKKVKYLSYVFYQKHMGEGEGNTYGGSDWKYLPPRSIGLGMLNKVCDLLN